jgi:ankyrin repeat protein
MLRQPGLDVDWAQPDTGSTASYITTQEGNDKCLSHLVSHGADTSKADKKGWAPIHIACQNGRYACLEVLADAGADLNLRLESSRKGEMTSQKTARKMARAKREMTRTRRRTRR